MYVYIYIYIYICIYIYIISLSLSLYIYIYMAPNVFYLSINLTTIISSLKLPMFSACLSI